MPSNFSENATCVTVCLVVTLFTLYGYWAAKKSLKKTPAGWKRNAVLIVSIVFWPTIATFGYMYQVRVTRRFSKLDELTLNGHHIFMQKKQTKGEGDPESGSKALSEWGKKYVDPSDLSEKIISSGIIPGMSKAEIVKYMGQPVYPESENMWFYVFIRDDGEWFFKIDFKSGVAIRAYLEHDDVE